MRPRLSITLLVVVTVLGGGGCSTAPKHGAASVPPNVSDDYGMWFYVGGEVNYPSRQIIGSRITLLKAIACAGGFTPSANKKKVQLTRHHDGEQRIIDCTSAERQPELDVQIYPGDSIYVPRSSKWLFW
jgi:hypothetical protein